MFLPCNLQALTDLECAPPEEIAEFQTKYSIALSSPSKFIDMDQVGLDESSLQFTLGLNFLGAIDQKSPQSLKIYVDEYRAKLRDSRFDAMDIRDPQTVNYMNLRSENFSFAGDS